ncbi:ATP-binding protein [Sinosporangium siamense]|uniref:ATP-binding protein n=1 Tax=Sinosporangium siamense TaxID=1367973 RepID=UPI001EF30431|nr:ATP-binding protein [Sinosporangium siamense]
MAIGEARRFTTLFLKGWPSLDDAELIVRELATNAVRHTRSGDFGGHFTVCIRVDGVTAWLAVVDQGGPRTPHMLSEQADEESGRGLRLVAALSLYTVAGREKSKTFEKSAQAKNWLSVLRQAAKNGEAFDIAAGLPMSMVKAKEARTFYKFALAYVDMKWRMQRPRAATACRTRLPRSSLP